LNVSYLKISLTLPITCGRGCFNWSVLISYAFPW